jgi:hypothetical protein
VFYLLEPASDDGLTTWNVIDEALEVGGTHPMLNSAPGQTVRTEAGTLNGGPGRALQNATLLDKRWLFRDAK